MDLMYESNITFRFQSMNVKPCGTKVVTVTMYKYKGTSLAVMDCRLLKSVSAAPIKSPPYTYSYFKVRITLVERFAKRKRLKCVSSPMVWRTSYVQKFRYISHCTLLVI